MKPGLISGFAVYEKLNPVSFQIIVDDVDAPRHAERKLLIGQTLIFLQISEGKGGFAPLAVERLETADLIGRRIQIDDEVIVVRVGLMRLESQSVRSRDCRVRIARDEIARDVSLAREKQR